MLKVLVLGFGVLVGGAAGAQESGAETPADWQEANYVCEMGAEEAKRIGYTSSDAVEACRTRNRLSDLLQERGYCWSSTEGEWFIEDTPDLCDPPVE